MIKVNVYKVRNNKTIMQTKLISLIVLSIFLISFVSSSLGTYKRGDCVNIRTILNSSSVNISTISTPNSIVVISNQIMTKQGQTFNYTFCNTSNLGTYIYDYFDSNGDVYVNSFEITTSGREAITSGESNTLLISIVIMLIISIFFLIVGFKMENLAGKIILTGTGIILLLAIFLYSVVNMNQILGGFSVITEGYTTFWFVIKIIFGIALTAFIVFMLWYSYQAFMIKRGFRD